MPTLTFALQHKVRSRLKRAIEESYPNGAAPLETNTDWSPWVP